MVATASSAMSEVRGRERWNGGNDGDRHFMVENEMKNDTMTN